MTDLSIIPLKNNLLVDATFNGVKQQIIARLNDIGIADSKYKSDAEFLALVCNLVEHLISKKDKVDKKTLVISTLDQLFCLSEDEKLAISKNIDFLCSQKGLVKKISFYKLFKTGIKEWLKFSKNG